MIQLRTNTVHLCAFLLLLVSPIVCVGQDRDITEGSTSGSVRPDTQRPTGPRRRMLTAESRAALVAEFELFRGAETLMKAPSFEALRDTYREALERAAREKPIATDLTPLKYLVFELMARELSQKKAGIDSERLANDMISTYVKTRNFLPPILAAGFTQEEARLAERNAVLVLHQLTRQRLKSRNVPAAAAVAAGGPPPGTVQISYGVVVNDRPRQERAGVPKRRGTVSVQIRVAPQFVVGITNDTFSSKKRADGSYITGLGNTTTSLKYEAVPNLLSFSYTVTFPTASVEKTLGSGRLDHKIMGDLSKTVKDTTLGLSLGYLFTGIKGESGFLKTGLAALLVSQPLDDKFTYKGEIDLASRAKNTASEIFAINQVVYKINDTFSIRAGARTGITANSPRIGFTAGLSINTLLK